MSVHFDNRRLGFGDWKEIWTWREQRRIQIYLCSPILAGKFRAHSKYPRKSLCILEYKYPSVLEAQLRLWEIITIFRLAAVRYSSSFQFQLSVRIPITCICKPRIFDLQIEPIRYGPVLAKDPVASMPCRELMTNYIRMGKEPGQNTQLQAVYRQSRFGFVIICS